MDLWDAQGCLYIPVKLWEGYSRRVALSNAIYSIACLRDDRYNIVLEKSFRPLVIINWLVIATDAMLYIVCYV